MSPFAKDIRDVKEIRKPDALREIARVVWRGPGGVSVHGNRPPLAANDGMEEHLVPFDTVSDADGVACAVGMVINFENLQR